MPPSDPLTRYLPEIRLALTIRLVEQRLLTLFQEGRLFGTVHTCIGQEFAAVAVGRGLRPQDTVVSNHRGHGHFLAYRLDINGLIAEIMGRATGVCGGRGGSQHLHQGNFYSNGILAGMLPAAAGLAYAHQQRQDGGIAGGKVASSNLAVAFFGDGAFGEGILYETFNLASKWNLPLLLVCENNRYAQSTAQEQTLAGDILKRAEAFGIQTRRGSTWEWPALFAEAVAAMDEVRTAGCPIFLLIDTDRLMAHSKGDDNRPAEELERYWQRDPIKILQDQYAADPTFQAMQTEIAARVEAAVEAADAAPFADLAGANAPKPSPDDAWTPLEFDPERTVVSIRKGLEAALASRPETVLIGEDIESPYGGAFKATDGLSQRFPGCVRNTPVSEAALLGLGNGLALAGLRPVVEIMFGDFLALAADQWINHAAKFRWIYNDRVQVALVVRTPMGGRRGYGATHSQSLEKHFLGLPGTQVLCLHQRFPAEDLYRRLFEDLDRPTLVIENKILYGQTCSSEPPPGFRLLVSSDRFPTVRLQPLDSADLTVLAFGGAGLEAEEALKQLAEQEEIRIDLFLPTRLYPFDLAALFPSLRQTRRLLVVEEGQGFVSLGGEVLAQLAEAGLTPPVTCRRLAAAAHPIPSARPLESQSLPGAEAIAAAALELFDSR